jgi:hypothetical protein
MLNSKYDDMQQAEREKQQKEHLAKLTAANEWRTRNPWIKQFYNLTRQGAVYKASPALAAELQEIAIQANAEAARIEKAEKAEQAKQKKPANLQHFSAL